MKKLFLIILFIFLNTVAYSEENIDKRYNYNNINDQFSINNGISDDTEILFIVDFSGSMNKRLGYAPKAFLAVDAIRSILNDIGQNTKIGLRVFGVTDRSLYEYSEKGIEYNTQNICSASSLVMPIAKYNNDNISSILSRYRAQGATPIGYSLRQAVQYDFSPNASIKHIILVTDGYENCGDDPCNFIKRIMKLRTDIKIDVIGITLSENEYSKLSCITNYSNGKFIRIDSPDDFNIKFREIFINYSYSDNTKKQIPENNNLKDNFKTKLKNFAYEFKN